MIRPTQLHIETSYPVQNTAETPEDKENRLKQWQGRLRGAGTESTPTKTVRNRNLTGVNQEEVRAALQIARQTEEPQRKTKEHDNDEGFEETQSQMSESPSQGASSDLVDSGEYTSKGNKPVRTSSLESKCTVDSTSASSTNEAPTKPKRATDKAPRVQSERMHLLLQRYSRPVERSISVRTTQPDDAKKSVIPRRAASLRKTDSQNSVTRRNTPVERSNSRQSLVSSRSSLNSAASTNTVKKMPLKSTKTVPSKTSTVPPRKPLTMQQPKMQAIKRVPSGSTLASQKPPSRSAGATFMRPTTSSTTKTYTPPIAPTGRLLQYRASTFK